MHWFWLNASPQKLPLNLQPLQPALQPSFLNVNVLHCFCYAFQLLVCPTKRLYQPTNALMGATRNFFLSFECTGTEVFLLLWNLVRGHQEVLATQWNILHTTTWNSKKRGKNTLGNFSKCFKQGFVHWLRKNGTHRFAMEDHLLCIVFYGRATWMDRH